MNRPSGPEPRPPEGPGDPAPEVPGDGRPKGEAPKFTDRKKPLTRRAMLARLAMGIGRRRCGRRTGRPLSSRRRLEADSRAEPPTFPEDLAYPSWRRRRALPPLGAAQVFRSRPDLTAPDDHSRCPVGPLRA